MRQQQSDYQYRSLVLCTLLLAVGVPGASTLRGQVSQPHLRTLTTAYQAHSLTSEEAAKGYPVRLHAVATYYDPYINSRGPVLFVHDSTGAVYVHLVAAPATFITPGTLMEVTGVSAAGDFAPVVSDGRIRVLGKSNVPAKAPFVSLTQLRTGTYDGQWVEMEGVIHSIRKFGHNVELNIFASDGALCATTIMEEDRHYEGLVNATVRIHANAAPIFNNRLQLTGARLYFPGLQEVTIEEAPVADAFAIPITPIDHLLRYAPNVKFQHQVHVRGQVTLQWPGRSLCIQESSHGVCVQTTATTRLAFGETVDLVGFPAISGLTPTLMDSTFRSAGLGEPVVAMPINAGQALAGDQDAKLVQIEGKLIAKDRASKDPTMVLASGKFLFPVVLPSRSWDRSVPVWEEGSKLRITGICSVKVEAMRTDRGFSVPASFQILLRSPSDVVVIEEPSWWTPAHLLPFLAVALLITLCALGWVWVLRHRVADQTTVIREQNASLRKLSFQDGLTGIANRRKFDEILDTECGRAAKSATPVSLLMIDVDHFKALNDSYGHQRGDECLVQVARALVSASMRKTDVVARYGGEEFAVVLPGCDEAEAVAVAERMRAAVLNLSIPNSGSPVHGRVSISIGVATLLAKPGMDSARLVSIADCALYQSKIHGRNRTTSSQAQCPEAQCPEAETARKDFAGTQSVHTWK